MATAEASEKAEKKALAAQKKAEKEEKLEAREKKVAEKAAKAEMPKRAKSSYMLFADDVRDDIMKEMKAKSGKVDMGALAKDIGERWAKLAEADKSKYQARASEGKEKHDEEMKAYKEKKDPVGTLKDKYADLIPKKPLSTYVIFSSDEASRQKATEAAGKDASHKEITAKLGEQWKGLSADAKALFEKRREAALKEYEEKLQVWQASPQFAELKKLEEEQKAKEQEEKEAAKAATPPSKKRRLPADSAEKAKPAKIAKTAEPTERMGTDGWQRFTPKCVDPARCMSRTWANGHGEQCGKRPIDGSEFCKLHSNGKVVHGRVDGPIPDAKLNEFRLADSGNPAVLGA